MEMNLKTTLRVYPKLSSSILEDYVTKEALTEANYVTKDDLDTTLLDFVKDVDSTGNDVYGRKNGEWVKMIDIPEIVDEVMCYGIDSSDKMTSEILLTLNRQAVFSDVNEYLVEDESDENGYFWFCCTKPIFKVMTNNGMAYEQMLKQQTQTIYLTIEDKNYLFYCYRTNKLASIGLSYKFKVKIGG